MMVVYNMAIYIWLLGMHPWMLLVLANLLLLLLVFPK